jgi:hypothetical protein
MSLTNMRSSVVVLALCLILLLAVDVSAQPVSPDNKPSPAPTSQPADRTPLALPPDAPIDAPPKAKLQLSMEQPEVGDHWTIEAHNTTTGVLEDVHTVTITAVTATEIGLRADTVGKPGFRSEIYDRSWNRKNNSGKEFSLGDGTGIKLPLKVGSTWDPVT